MRWRAPRSLVDSDSCVFIELWVPGADDNHPDTDDEHDDERDPEQQPINDGRERAPVIGVLCLLLQLMLTTRYLSHITHSAYFLPRSAL